MVWMVIVCIIMVVCLCRFDLLLRVVDEVIFWGFIKVGDRVIFKIMVNNIFDVYMEVGCCVEVYEIGGDLWYVNSVFLIFVVFDDKGVFKILLLLWGEIEDGKWCVVEVMVRKCFCLDCE